MSGTKFGTAVLVTLLPLTAAAQMSMGEATARQADIARAEMDLRLATLKKQLEQGTLQAPPLPTHVQIAEKDASDMIQLVAVYGIGNELRADFLFQNAPITLTPKSKTSIAGWYLESLSPAQAVLIKRGGKGAEQRSVLYLSGSSTEPRPGEPQNGALSSGSTAQQTTQPPLPDAKSAQAIPVVPK